jgi:hypothetical protein
MYRSGKADEWYQKLSVEHKALIKEIHGDVMDRLEYRIRMEDTRYEKLHPKMVSGGHEQISDDVRRALEEIVELKERLRRLYALIDDKKELVDQLISKQGAENGSSDRKILAISARIFVRNLYDNLSSIISSLREFMGEKSR